MQTKSRFYLSCLFCLALPLLSGCGSKAETIANPADKNAAIVKDTKDTSGQYLINRPDSVGGKMTPEEERSLWREAEKHTQFSDAEQALAARQRLDDYMEENRKLLAKWGSFSSAHAVTEGNAIDREFLEDMENISKRLVPEYTRFFLIDPEKFLLGIVPEETSDAESRSFSSVARRAGARSTGMRLYPRLSNLFSIERSIVITWKGCTMDNDRVEMFAQRLVPELTIDNIEEYLTVRTGYFETVLTGPRFCRLFNDISRNGFTDETTRRILQGFIVGPDGQGILLGSDGSSTALIVTLAEEDPSGKGFADVLETIKKIGRECGVQPHIQIDERSIFVDR